jgi:hypothetical protein
LSLLEQADAMMKRTWVLSTTLFLTVVAQQAVSQTAWAAPGDSRNFRYAPAYAPTNQPAALDPRNVPDFAGRPDVAGQTPQQAAGGSTGGGAPGTPLQADASSTTIPVETRLRLVLESAVDAKSSQPGNIFEAHVKNDLFLGNSLLLAKGSLVRGRVCEVTKPRLLSRAGKIGLKLEQIVTPVGEVIPLDAGLEFHKGVTNAKGQLDPGTSLGSRVHDDVRSATGMNSKGATRNILVTANVATLGAPAVAAALGGGAIALFRSGDNVNLMPGQELEVLLTNDLGLQLN